MCGVDVLRMRRSMTFDGVLSNVMGLYEAASVGDLLGLRSVIILPTFHMYGILECE